MSAVTMGYVTKQSVGAFLQGQEAGTLVGYSAMRFDGVWATTGSGMLEQPVTLCPGAVHTVRGPGIPLVPTVDNAINNAVHERTAILKYEFCPTTITSDTITDTDPEVTVYKATLVSAFILE